MPPARRRRRGGGGPAGLPARGRPDTPGRPGGSRAVRTRRRPGRCTRGRRRTVRGGGVRRGRRAGACRGGRDRRGRRQGRRPCPRGRATLGPAHRGGGPCPGGAAHALRPGGAGRQRRASGAVRAGRGRPRRGGASAGGPRPACTRGQAPAHHPAQPPGRGPPCLRAALHRDAGPARTAGLRADVRGDRRRGALAPCPQPGGLHRALRGALRRGQGAAGHPGPVGRVEAGRAGAGGARRHRRRPRLQRPGAAAEDGGGAGSDRRAGRGPAGGPAHLHPGSLRLRARRPHDPAGPGGPGRSVFRSRGRRGPTARLPGPERLSAYGSAPAGGGAVRGRCPVARVRKPR
ncbi:hypothetical protein [Ornithinimicrobium kibberense]|uniref:hypothetical protein n=1 Tax=Ornithinimicrobium kibberense TaxID=282060 RepID=UPI00361B7F31